MFSKKLIITGLAALLTSGLAKAEESAPKWYETLKLDGFADAYYKANFNGIQGTGSGTKTFDKYQNMFALAGGRVGLKSADGFAVMDLYLGDYAKVLQSSAALTTENEAVLGQAYVSQALGPVTATLGLFMTHVGYEVVDSVANLNYTRSLLYGQVPFYHTGLKLAYAPVEGLGLMVQLDNGNSVLVKTNEGGGAGAQISYTGVKGLALYGNYYYEQVKTGAYWEAKHYLDFVGSYAIMDGLTFAAEYLYWTQKASTATNTAGAALGSSMTDPATGLAVAYSPKTQGYAAYLDYATPLTGLSVTPRFEALYAPDSFTTTYDYTLTLRHVKGAITNWLELRNDVVTKGGFAVAPKNVGGPETPQNELTLTWGVGYKF